MYQRTQSRLLAGMAHISRTLIAVPLAAALLFAGLESPASASTTAPPTTIPATTCATPFAMFCSVSIHNHQAYMINYVGEVDGEQQFCQQVNLVDPVHVTCHPYWPFVNPTVNEWLAPADAFNDMRLVATRRQVDSLNAEISKAQAVADCLRADNARLRRDNASLERDSATLERRVARKAERIERLRERIMRLRHR